MRTSQEVSHSTARHHWPMTPRRSAAWTVALRVEYAVLRVLDPLIRWMWFSVGIGITSRLTVRGRRTGRERSVLVGLLRVNGAWYVGHPNGEVGWTANLRAAGRATIAQRAESPFEVTAVPLGHGSGARRGHPGDRRAAAVPRQPRLPRRPPAHPQRGPILPPRAGMKSGPGSGAGAAQAHDHRGAFAANAVDTVGRDRDVARLSLRSGIRLQHRGSPRVTRRQSR